LHRRQAPKRLRLEDSSPIEAQCSLRELAALEARSPTAESATVARQMLEALQLDAPALPRAFPRKACPTRLRCASQPLTCRQTDPARPPVCTSTPRPTPESSAARLA